MYDHIETSAKFIKSKTKLEPKIGLVLGSGLGAFVDAIQDKCVIPYSEIPHFKTTAVEGHEGKLILGKVAGVAVAVMQGRIHAYEGHSQDEVVFPTRVLGTMGIKTLILTNAAGGINSFFRPGDLVLIDDHINLMGRNPLVGPNLAKLGPRFPDMTEAYDTGLKEILLATAKDMGYHLKRGVYAGLLGPTYETPAEIRMLGIIGSDMVGMSTVPETIVANHMGIRVAGISCITNMAAGIHKEKLRHEDIKDQAMRIMHNFTRLLQNTVEKIGQQNREIA